MTAHLRNDWIRVQDKKSKGIFTIAASAFSAEEVDRLENKAAVDENGAPLPPESAEPAAEPEPTPESAPKSLSSKSSGQKATDKEGA